MQLDDHNNVELMAKQDETIELDRKNSEMQLKLERLSNFRKWQREPRPVD